MKIETKDFEALKPLIKESISETLNDWKNKEFEMKVFFQSYAFNRTSIENIHKSII